MFVQFVIGLICLVYQVYSEHKKDKEAEKIVAEIHERDRNCKRIIKEEQERRLKELGLL